MEVHYDDPKVQEQCENERERRRRWGPISAKKLATRLRDLAAVAETLDDMRMLPGKCHELQHNWARHLALSLDGGLRLIIRPKEWITNSGGGLDWKAVTAVVIVTVEDYH